MAATTPSYNQSHALIIGINDYKVASPLGYAVSDAEAVADCLRSRYSFESAYVNVLLNADATRTSIHKALLDFARDSTHADDRLLVFFAGHGHTERTGRGDTGYLVPCDGDPSDLSTLIRWDTLTRDAELIEAKHVLFIMDACYGGLAITRSLKPGSSRFLKDMLRRRARQVLTAGKADEVVADLGGPRPNHSVFTGHFLDALDGAAEAEGVLTANGVMAYVYQQVGTDPNSQQTPHYGYINGDGDFIFNPPNSKEIDTSESKDQDILIPIPGTKHPDTSGPEDSVVDRVKGLLRMPEDRMALRDLVVQESRAALASISTDAFEMETDWSENELVDRLAKYNEATKNLRGILMVLGQWGTDSHHDIITLPVKRIAEQIAPASGLVAWTALRWYPVLVLIYSCGLGSVTSERYSNLRTLIHAQLPDPMSRFPAATTVLKSLSTVETDYPFKGLPGHERQYTPASEYLFKELQPLADDVLFIGAEYEEYFDRLEILMFLECALIDGVSGHFGRFAWKHKSILVSDSPFNALIAEAEAEGDQWPPIRGGFFAGSVEKFKEAVSQYSPKVEGLPWR